MSKEGGCNGIARSAIQDSTDFEHILNIELIRFGGGLS